MSNPFEDLWNTAKQGAGDLVSGGAHLLGDGLNAVGAHGAAQDVEAAGDTAGYALGGDVPELQLGQTGDPRQLVHGDATAVRSAATKLHGFASGFGEVADGLHSIDTGHWEGQAADAFRAKFSPQPAKWQAATEAMGKAAAALESYAAAVEDAQGQARQAISLWDQAQRATAAATAAHDQQVAAYDAAAKAYDARLAAGQEPGTRPSQPAPFGDPGVVLRAQAQQVLASARSARDSSAASAAAAVSSATSLAPAEPSFLSQLEDNLSDTLKGGALGLASFTDGVVEGVAGIARFARSLDPLDPWNLEHPGEYAAGVSGTLAGLVNDAQDPAGLVKSMLGSGWGSDPAQALGKLAPTVAITAVTAGGGA
ncbi:MAG: hypothetical protein J2P25_21410, partial [Nocardiopsaceae bacterium]|nr:hypothetical protein [Nocardiopsaceae bacterium]